MLLLFSVSGKKQRELLSCGYLLLLLCFQYNPFTYACIRPMNIPICVF